LQGEFRVSAFDPNIRGLDLGLSRCNGEHSHTQTLVVAVGSLDQFCNELDWGVWPVQQMLVSQKANVVQAFGEATCYE
jgi:hypothetical protein